MTKQATSIRLSAEAEQNIKTIREKYAYLLDKTSAIEFAVWVVAHSHIETPGGMLPEATKVPAARPARRTAAKKEQER